MPKKESSYQKLKRLHKEKTDSLMNDILALIGERGFEAESVAKMKWKFAIESERVIWFSNHPQQK